MVTFEVKCMRCEKLITVDFEKLFSRLESQEAFEKAKKFIIQTPRMINHCPHCKKKTYQLVVTPLEGTISLIQPLSIIK